MQVNLRLLTFQIIGTFAVFALMLFGAAATPAWLAGWAFLVLFFGFVIALTLWLLKNDPGLLTERMTGIGKPDQKAWDKVSFAAVSVLYLVWLLIMSLDAVRFRWSQMPALVQAAGAILLVISFYLFFETFRANPYLSPAVRIQSERGHRVVSSGPYRYVRHPMYAAAFVFLVGTSLLLGSWYGLLAALVLVVLIAIRAVQEERMLRHELPGYDEYTQKVRYRLVPRVW